MKAPQIFEEMKKTKNLEDKIYDSGWIEIEPLIGEKSSRLLCSRI